MLLSEIKEIKNGRIITLDNFVESDHPRDENGKFGNKGEQSLKVKRGHVRNAEEIEDMIDYLKKRIGC